MLHRLLTLARVSNLPTVWSNCLAAWLISGVEPSWRLLPLLLGASLLYAAGCTLNDAFDAKWDAAHRPERIIPSGAWSRETVWRLGLAEMAAGLSFIFAGGVSAWWAPAGLAACILLYDAWHKQSPASVVVMGACRWMLYLTAAAAAGGNLQPVMICGAVMWLYVIVLSLVARGEAKREATVPRTRQLLLLVPLAVAAAAWGIGSTGRELWAPAMIAFSGIGLLIPATSADVGAWVNRLLAAIPVVDLSLFLTLQHRPVPFLSVWPLLILAAVGLSLLFQRWFRAT